MGPLDTDYPRLLLGTLVAAVMLTLAVTGATSTAAFSAFNPSWDGASALRERANAAGVEPQIVEDAVDLSTVPANGSLAVVLSPDRSYTPEETARLNEFVRDGGTLLVADDFGSNANRLLSTLGASARIDGTPLRDERSYYRSPAFPVANNVSDRPLVANVSRLTLNHGTAVLPNGATVLANSSSFAYLDDNRNGELDETETMDRYPIATVERVDRGRVIVVADPSIFINTMLDRPGNAAFVANLLSGVERVLLDTSSTADVPPLVRILLTIRGSALVQLVVGLAGLASIALWARRPGFVARLRDRVNHARPADRIRPSADEVAAAVAARNPEWDEERIRRVSRRIERTDEPTNRRGE